MLRYLAKVRYKGISIVVCKRAEFDRFWWRSKTTALHYTVDQTMIAQTRIDNVGLNNFMLNICETQANKRFGIKFSVTRVRDSII